MKKSIIRVLTFSLVMGGVGLMSSCKDYDEDFRTEYDSKLANLDVTLNEKIDQQVAILTGKLSDLEAQLAAIKSCTCGVDKPWTSDLAAAIQNALDEIDKKYGNGGVSEEKLRAIISEILTKELAGYCSKAEVEKLIEERLKNLGVEGCVCDLDALKAEVAGMIQTAITNTITKEYVTNLVNGEYVNQAEFDALKARVDQIVLQGCACGDLAAAVQKLESDLAKAQETLKQHGDDITKLYELYNNLNTTLINLANRVDNIEKMAEAAKDAAEKAVAKAEEALKLANEVWEALKNTTPGSSDPLLEARVILLENFKKEWQPILISWVPMLDEMYHNIDGLTNLSSELRQDVDALKQKLKETYKLADEANERSKSNYTLIMSLDTIYHELGEQVNVNKDSIYILSQECKANLEAAKAYTDQQVAVVKATLEAFINNKIDSLDSALKAIDAQTNARIDSLNNAINGQFETVETDVNSLKLQVGMLKGNVASLQATVGELVDWQTEVTNTIEGLNTAIEALTDRVKDAEDRLTDVEGRVTALEGSVERMQNTLKQMVTGIIVNQIENPVFGSVNLPVGISSHLLVSFYGENEGDLVLFPNNATHNYLYANEAFTQKEWDMISSVEQEMIEPGTLTNDKGNKAGTVYLTINPNTVDFTGLKMELVNSQNKSAGMALAPLAKSNKVLDFGVTRAADNGFYEMDVTVPDHKAVQKIDFEAGEFKEIFKEIKNFQDGLDLTKIVNICYDQFHSILDANALKVTWEDGEGNAHSVMSDYTIAATAVKPLSYKFLADKKFTSVPGFERLENAIDKFAGKIRDKLKGKLECMLYIDMPECPKMKKFSFDEVDVDKEVASFLIEVDAFLEIDGKYYAITQDLDIVDEHGYVVGKLPAGSEIYMSGDSMVVKVTVDLREIVADLYVDITSNVNDLFDALKKYCDDMTKTVDSFTGDLGTTIDEAYGKLTDRLHTVLSKIEGKMVDFMNNIIAHLQPVMLYSANGTTARMSGMINKPSVINTTTITLHPFSYTAETINPAYRKHVAVINVIKGSKSAQDGDADCLAALKAANAQANMNTPLSGEVRSIRLTGLKKGYTYQIAYTAMDYSGCIVTKRNAVKVK